jgi:hypothetical protein
MTPDEFVGYVIEGVKWLAIGGGSHLGLLLGCQICDLSLFHKKIKSQEELEKVVAEEAIKLGLDHSKIDAKLYDGKITGARKNGDECNLRIAREDSTRNVVRHELYHLLKDCDRRNPTFCYYWFVAEPRATLYGTFGIKF